jgi:hypothetical protein
LIIRATRPERLEDNSRVLKRNLKELGQLPIKKPIFQLSKVAEYVSLQTRKERCWSTESPDKREEGACSLSFEYPRFLSTSPGVQQINAIIEKRITDAYSKFSKTQDEQGEKVSVEKGDEWFDEHIYSIAYYGEDLISLLVTNPWYAGGAHSQLNYGVR